MYVLNRVGLFDTDGKNQDSIINSFVMTHSYYRTIMQECLDTSLGIIAQIHYLRISSITQATLIHFGFIHSYTRCTVCPFEYIAKSDMLASADVQFVLDLVHGRGLVCWFLTSACWHLPLSMVVTITLDTLLLKQACIELLA